jgi:hypothetical protein
MYFKVAHSPWHLSTNEFTVSQHHTISEGARLHVSAKMISHNQAKLQG